MSRALQPIAQVGSPRPDDALPLAGNGAVWWRTARGDGVERRASDLADAARHRLSELRAPIAGLSLDRPRIMGILNITPDSFSDGGQVFAVEAALDRARKMATEADILDIGGESTRPGSAAVPEKDEIARVVPVIEAIRAAGITTPISIDTRKASVAAAAIDAGADIVNDVAAMTYDSAMAGLVAERGVPVCLMHAQGDPETMQNDPRYDDLVLDVFDWLAGRIEAAEAAGIKRDKIITDPGIGFGKTLQHNVSLLQNLSIYHDLGCPILLGASRKRFIGTIGNAPDPLDRVAGSVAVALHGAAQAVQMLRVHDTFETRQALSLQQAIFGTDIL
ncbi:MAG: dihydropteroate synthase [Rhodobacteraceae bacterium]|nr:dihydropteroate synthase [Paracoccaceae bacterium]